MTLSPEHQRMVASTLESMEIKQPLLKDSIITRLWGDRPILVSTYTHPSIDTEARIVIGDLMWKEITDPAENTLTNFHLAWEPSPPGSYKILEIPLPNQTDSASRVIIDSGFSIIPWWLPATEANISHFYSAFLEPSTWVSVAKKLDLKLQQSNFTGYKRETILENLSSLQKIYADALTSINDGGLTLAQVAENLYLRLASELVGGEITGKFKQKLRYMAQIGMRINETLLVLDQQMPLEIILQNLLEQGGQKLFVAGNQTSEPTYVGYSTKKNQFAIDRADSKTGKSVGKSQPITKPDLINLLQSGAVFPTGKLFMVALTYIASQIPVIHMGNDYGWGEKTKTAMKTDKVFHQFFPDYSDSWPFIIPLIEGQPYTGEMITLSGLYVLFKKYPNIADYVGQSLSTGRPINVEV